METGEEVLYLASDNYTNCLTYDASTSTLYGVAPIDGLSTLVTIDLSGDEAVFNTVHTLEPGNFGMWNSIACDSHGQMYGIYGDYDEATDACTGSTLYKIDKYTGALTKVGETGYDCPYFSSSAFDLKTDKLYWCVSPADETGLLTEVNTTTGATTLIYHFPNNEEVVGLYVQAPAAEDGAPAIVTDLKPNFIGASLSGTIDFTAPATLFDGSAASGALSYTIVANGEEIATGNTTFGAEVSAEVTVPAPGFYTFVVTTSNAAGASPKAKTSLYVGPATPASTKVTASYADGAATVTWDAVTSGTEGAYFDPEGVTYIVTRQPDNVVVGDKVKGTSLTDTFAAPDKITTFFYEVVVEFEGAKSAPAMSNTFTLGSIYPPFLATFDDGLEGFTTIDANGDLKSWMNINGRARMAYNLSQDMDDWLITPAIKLEAGKLYSISCDFGAENELYAERVEVKLGKAATVDAMTTVLLEPTEITAVYLEPYEWATTFTPEEDGDYYIGIHGISDADRYYLYADNFAITAPKSATAPEAVSDLLVVPDINGSHTAEISFTTPAKDLNGDALTSLTKVVLSRNETVVKEWAAPAPGTKLTFTDALPGNGEYTYTVVACNESGDGADTSVSVYVGVDYPAAVTNVVGFETANQGEVTVTWDAVTETASGTPLSASQVTYQVYGFEGNIPVPVSEKLSTTSFTIQAVPAGEQAFVQYAVFAYTERGEGEGAISNFFAAGKPYDSYEMTSDADLDKYILGTDSQGGSTWSSYNYTYTGVHAQDGDDFFFGIKATYKGDYAELFTGLVSLGMENPGFSFYVFNNTVSGNPAGNINEFKIGVMEKGQTEYTYIKTVVVSQTGESNAWNRVIADLSAYAGKTVQVSILGLCNNSTYTYVDNISISSITPYDLEAVEVNAPGKVKAGEDYKVVANIYNLGSKDAENYSVELYVDGALAQTKEGTALASGFYAGVEFTLTMPVLATEPVEIYAKVVYAGDTNADNNATEPVSVTPVVSRYPSAEGVAGTVIEGAVKLSWSEPDLANATSEVVTEDFEDADSFADAYGEWIFVDKDESPVGGMQGATIPAITPGETTGSFWIWDQAQVGNLTFQAHSGTKYLFSMFRYDDGTVNDWAISPELDGTAQTISFYAKSYMVEYPEAIKLCYSTGSVNPDDFVEVKTVKPVAGEWTLYEFNVPEGAKRFAINSFATGAYMLMVDDVTFIPANVIATLELVGYDVYRDGVKINDSVVEECEFTDTNVENGHTYEYAVVAVYTTGLSHSSDVVSVLYQGSGIDSIAAGALSISTARGQIIVTGAAGHAVAVYAVDGKTIYSGLGEAKTVIPAPQGIYVVKAATTVKKVIVK